MEASIVSSGIVAANSGMWTEFVADLVWRVGMPLAFQSKSHGVVAFGFFNIESDMLLLDRNFFFADRFCQSVAAFSGAAGRGECRIEMDGWCIDDPRDVGNVNTAIQGLDLSGFIGATYRKFPFPADPAGFKQKPDGSKTQPVIEEMIERFGRRVKLPLSWNPDEQSVSVAEVVFDPEGFGQLVAYVDRGGYPRWKGDVRPEYVKDMMKKLGRADAPLAAALVSGLST
jgi:hypothetical protein